MDRDSGAIKRPIPMATRYALPYDPTILYLDFSPTYMATRYALPYDPALGGGEGCVVLASGVEALSGSFFALLNDYCSSPA